MSSSTINFILIFALTSFCILSTASAHFHPCTETFLSLTKIHNLSKCRELTTLGAEFGWKINQNNKNWINILFGTRLYEDFGWIAWGVNPGKMAQMVGTRAIVAVINTNGSISAKTYNITSDTKLGCKLEPTKFEEAQNEVLFQNISVYYEQSLDIYIMKAIVVLPSGDAGYSISRLNHVWQVGFDIEGDNPKKHPTILQNVDSTETINLETGFGHHVGRGRHHLRMVHGILNILGWGTFLPAGVIIARYFKYPLERFQNWQFCLHVSCQVTGYILGTSGWVVGLCLGNLSKFYEFKIHRIYAMLIFAFTTLQMLAIRLRPKRIDEYRKYWNMYHHLLGYGLLAVISINIFHGIDILKPKDNAWKWGYIGILIAFAIIVAILEIYSWTKFKRSSKQSNVQIPAANAPVTGPPIPQPRP
ncbi:hypothetical protein JCGZ_00924 [Jatropha curcas]|uniref:Cytochrome b561 and DOMON domain-containing protein n=1 Tax=Jatropha curcas TaxID=180498 RepID=A0A067KSQ0_JATCU|nr:cytochrome b561 and DOMON domain-containing protein At5g47530 [Jatropha curcas]KDP39167.1 hypothetical protein JCGZ_00924 [Jatropha curcas]